MGANYRASARAKSKADFINKIQIIVEEADETLYWLEIIEATNLSTSTNLKSLITEANELTAIFAATNKTAKSNHTTYILHYHVFTTQKQNIKTITCYQKSGSRNDT